MNKMTHDEMLKYSSELVVKNNPDEAVKLLVLLQKENEVLKKPIVENWENARTIKINNPLQQRIEKAIKDLELTKEKNIPFLDEYGNALLYIDKDHINYLINILRGEDNE